MNVIDALKNLGVDVSEGLDRVMGDVSLYEMMLGMFVDSVRDNPVALEEFDQGDLEGLIKKIHMLKGGTGNLGRGPLFNGYNQALVLLRGGQAAQAKAEFAKVLPTQTAVLDCIRQYQGA